MLRDNLKDELANLKIKKFSLEMDESTDSANKSVVQFHVRFVDDQKNLRSEFLGVRELKQGNAESIFTAAEKILEEYDLDGKNMVGLATDGAAVMLGIHTGVATRFKKKYPWLIVVHCMAHRLQLAAEKAAATIRAIQKYIGMQQRTVGPSNL